MKNDEIKSFNKIEFNYQLEIIRLKQKIKDLTALIEKQKELLTKEKTCYNDIDMPNFNINELETSLKLADKFTIKTIKDYLILDSYEIVKNMAKVVNN